MASPAEAKAASRAEFCGQGINNFWPQAGQKMSQGCPVHAAGNDCPGELLNQPRWLRLSIPAEHQLLRSSQRAADWLLEELIGSSAATRLEPWPDQRYALPIPRYASS